VMSRPDVQFAERLVTAAACVGERPYFHLLDPWLHAVTLGRNESADGTRRHFL
jgi:hypothetical protein